MSYIILSLAVSGVWLFMSRRSSKEWKRLNDIFMAIIDSDTEIIKECPRCSLRSTTSTKRLLIAAGIREGQQGRWSKWKDARKRKRVEAARGAMLGG